MVTIPLPSVPYLLTSSSRLSCLHYTFFPQKNQTYSRRSDFFSALVNWGFLSSRLLCVQSFREAQSGRRIFLTLRPEEGRQLFYRPIRSLPRLCQANLPAGEEWDKYHPRRLPASHRPSVSSPLLPLLPLLPPAFCISPVSVLLLVQFIVFHLSTLRKKFFQSIFVLYHMFCHKTSTPDKFKAQRAGSDSNGFSNICVRNSSG